MFDRDALCDREIKRHQSNDQETVTKRSTLGWGASPVDPISRPRYPIDPRLCVQPLSRLSQLALAWSVISGGPIGKGTTAPTNGHTSVGLGKVMFVEPNAQFLFR